MSNLERYLCGVAMLRQWHNQGIISDTEFTKAEKKMAKKYCIKKGSIYRQIRLINFQK